MEKKRRRLAWVLVLGAVLYCAFFFQLGRLPFVGADEPRYVRIGEEMLLRGEWVTPTLNFAPWLEKPPLLFWIEALSFLFLGVSEWTARLPVALLAMLTVLTCGFFAAKRWRDRTGLLTIVVLASTPLFFVYGRAASTDMPLVCFFTLAMLAALQATSGRGAWLLLSGTFLALAVLAKGPVALVLFAGIWGSYLILTLRLPWRLIHGLAAIACLLLLAVPWFYLVWLENGYNFVATFWLNHHVARFLTSIHHHSQPFWYYLPVLLVGFFPWIAFLGSALRRVYRQGAHFLFEPSTELVLWLWTLVPLLFFSASSSKLAGYILPILPPLALLVAKEWDGFVSGDLFSVPALRTQLALANALALILGMTLLFGIPLVYGSRSIGGLLAAPVLLGAIASHLEFRRRRASSVFGWLAASTLLLAGLAFWQASPLIGGFHSAKDLSLQASEYISKNEPLVFYRYFHHTALYYTDYRCTPQPVNSTDELESYFRERPQKEYWILTQKPGWLELERSFQPLSVQPQGNLYLVRIAAP